MEPKGYLVKHYFGAACGDNTSMYWFERQRPNHLGLRLGIKEGIEIESEGDIFGFKGLLRPHQIIDLY